MQNSLIEILLIDDDPAEADTIRGMLSQGRKKEFLVNHAPTLADGLDQLRSRSFDVVLLDLDLCDNRVLKIVQSVRNQAQNTPIIVLTTIAEEETAMQTLQMDIQDYLVKGQINSPLMARSIKCAIQQKRTVDKLQESEERFHATFDQAAVGISHLALDGSWLRINRKYCEIVGYTEEEMKALAIRDITHPDDVETSLQYFQRLVAGEIDNYSLEKRYIRKDGTIVWVTLTASAIRDATGNPRFIVGFIEDITPRRQVEQALRFSEARYKALFQDNPSMITTIDGGLTMLSVNPFCAGQLGYSIDELEGRSVLDIFHPDDRPAVVVQLLECLNNPNRVYQWQFRKIRKDGEPLWVEEIAQAVYDPFGALNVLVVCQDITERKRSEEEIEKLNEQLAARASELEAANRELEAFNYTVAHDLRKPLTVINLLCQKIEELCGTNLKKECRDFLRESYVGTLRMNQLIDSLLNFSRLSRAEPHRERVNLSAIARASAAELERSMPERRITFRIAEGIMAQGDVDLLRVVFDNLLDNACKHTAMREEAVIDFGLVNIDGTQACFVRDNGSGFDMADADKLFIPFHCLPGTEQFRGFGIGLATVERIIRRHDGKVWAMSEPGKGATFYFTLGFL